MDVTTGTLTLRVELPEEFMQKFEKLYNAVCGGAPSDANNKPQKAKAVATQRETPDNEGVQEASDHNDGKSDGGGLSVADAEPKQMAAGKLDSLKRAFKDIAQKHGTTAVRAILKKCGCSQLSKLDPSKYELAAELALEKLNEGYL